MSLSQQKRIRIQKSDIDCTEAIKKAVEAEREECAKVAEKMIPLYTAVDVAKAIRARKT